MRKSGFTMIELIFVIIILGILAAVAVPKLATTSDNAKVSRGVADISTLVKDLGTYYITHGSFDLSEGGPANMTNVLVDSSNLSNGTKFYYEVPTGTNCIGITVSDANGSIVISYNPQKDTIVCQGISDRLTRNGLLKEHRFGGVIIE